LRIEKALLWTRQATITETTYLLASTLGQDAVVTVEHPTRPDAELADTRPPDARTAEWQRWTVPCPARRSTSFVVAERTYHWQQQYLLDQSYDALLQYLASRWLDQPTLDRIRSLLEARQAIARNEEEIAKLEGERQRIYEREDQLRKNLGALSISGEEASLRQQVFFQLRAAEERLNAIDDQIAALQEQNRQRQAALDAALQEIAVPDTTEATSA
jgi:hypothetical protein